ncbi:hypothetical protein ACGC1H_001052 [Rhizoctonia solani]
MSLNDAKATDNTYGGLLTTLSAKSTVVSSGMNDPVTPPINKLPSEILATIMQIVTSYAPCCWRGEMPYTNNPALRYPDTLTHVCSRWRQVAIHSRNLWSHVDIPIRDVSYSRVTTFLNRAGQSPLSLHLSDEHDKLTGGSLVSLIAPITSPIKSLELDKFPNGWIENYVSTLSICLATCTAGTLTEFVVRVGDQCLAQRHPRPTFIKARNHPGEIYLSGIFLRPIYIDLDLPQERLEAVLRDVTVLRLDRHYFQWSSSVYHGLVELRLLGRRGANTCISESQLIDMLSCNPRLRILHFGLEIVDVAPLETTSASSEPIILRELEVLNLDWLPTDGIEIFLRWLAPAPKLSQFSFRPFEDDERFEHPATIAFLAGSSITTVHVVSSSLVAITSLVKHCRHIQVLAIEDTYLNQTRQGVSYGLNTLYLINCTCELRALVQLIQPIASRLIVYDSEFCHRRRSPIPSDLVSATLSNICVDAVILADPSPNPIKGWELFWNE